MKFPRVVFYSYITFVAIPLGAAAPATSSGSTGTNSTGSDPVRTAIATTNSAPKIAREGSRLSPALRDLVSMADAGVPQEVLLAYVQNSQYIFSPSPQNIIYLKDVGLPVTVLTTILAHDKALRDSATQMQMQMQMPMPPTAPALPPESVPPGLPPYQQNQPPSQDMMPGTPGTAPSVPYPGTYNVAPQYDTSVPPQAGYFYNDLAPYGSWYSLPGHGWAWQPHEAAYSADWAPYCNDGRWFYSNYGWYWHSDYPWGWAAFHYGRWGKEPSMGWLWFPDTKWASSWVNWRCSPQFCGWSPLPPFSDPAAGPGAAPAGNSFSGAAFDPVGNAGDGTFVPIDRFTDPNVGDFKVNSAQARSLASRSVLVNNLKRGMQGATSNQGFDPGRVGAISHRKVSRLTVQDPPADASPVPDMLLASDSASSDFAGQSPGLSVFRPRLETGPALSSAQATKINPRFPFMRPGLLHTGQPTTAQSQEINPFFPQLRPGPQIPGMRNGFFLAPFPSGATTIPGGSSFNSSAFNSGFGGLAQLGGTGSGGGAGTTGPLPNFAPPGTVPGSIGPLPSFSPPGTVIGSGGPAIPPFSPPGTVRGSGGGSVPPFSPPGTVAPVHGGGRARGGGGGGGHR